MLTNCYVSRGMDLNTDASTKIVATFMGDMSHRLQACSYMPCAW